MDYLAEELKTEKEIIRKEATRARKAGKHERIAKLLKNLVKEQPAPLMGLLDVMGNEVL